MRKSDLETMIKNLKEVTDLCNKQDYNTSSYVNTRILPSVQILEEEYERLDSNKIEINCPQIELIDLKTAMEANRTLVEQANYRMRELTINQFKVIDFGFLNEAIYIKYTS